jgi:hypothetical protein
MALAHVKFRRHLYFAIRRVTVMLHFISPFSARVVMAALTRALLSFISRRLPT